MEPTQEHLDTFSLIFGWASIALGVFGAIGTIFGIMSYRSAKRSDIVYSHLFKIAEQNIDKLAAEEDLARSRQRVQAETDKIRELQNTIREEIPKEARRAVLRDKIKGNVDLINETYVSLEQSRAILAEIGEAQEIPEELHKAIENEIMPEYLLERRKSNLRNYLTIVTASAAIGSILLPYPLSSFITWGLLVLLGVPIILALLRLSWPEIKDIVKPLANRACGGFLFTLKFHPLILFSLLFLCATGSAYLTIEYDRYILPKVRDFLAVASFGTMALSVVLIAVRLLHIAFQSMRKRVIARQNRQPIGAGESAESSVDQE